MRLYNEGRDPLPIKKHNISLKTCRSNKARRFLIALLFFMTCATALIGAFNSAANAAEVTLAWDASQIPDIGGYKLYSRQCLLNEECTLTTQNGDVTTIPLSDLGQYQSNPQYTTHNLSDEHQFAFAVTVYNNSGEESPFSNQVVFTPPNAPDDSTDDSDDGNAPVNQPPVVNAGQDQTIAIGAGEITLAGDVKDDGLPEDGSVTTAWKLKDGPTAAEIENALELTTKVTFKQSGAYTFELTANDGELTASDTIIITVNENTTGDSDDNPTPPTDDSPPPTTDDDPAPDQTDDEKQIIVIDNSDPADLASSQGKWIVSKGANPNGNDSLYAKKGATFTYHFTCPETGTYDLASWWTYYYNRSNAVDISIQTAAGEKHVSVDQKQKQNTAQWFSLGQYQFIAGDTYDIMITAGPKGTTCADAVQLSYLNADTNSNIDSDSNDSNNEPLIIDNLDQIDTMTTGKWIVSKGKNPYGANSVYGTNSATFTFEFESLKTGMQDVSIWWTFYRNRSSAVPVTIESENQPVTKKVNQYQRENGGKWNSLGQYKFVKGQLYTITITAPKKMKGKKSKTACADAVKIE